MQKEYLLNHIDGFNPYEYIESTIDEFGKKKYFLPTFVKEAWLKMVYPNSKIRVIQNYSIEHECYIGGYKAYIYDNRNNVIGKAEELSAKEAKDSALSDAGFGSEIEFFLNREEGERL